MTNNVSKLIPNKLLCAYVNQLSETNNKIRFLTAIHVRLETFELLLTMLCITKDATQIETILGECRQFINLCGMNTENKDILHEYSERAKRIINTLEKVRI